MSNKCINLSLVKMRNMIGANGFDSFAN